MFKNKSSFYIKTLSAYGILLSLLYCSSMQYDPICKDSEQLVVIGNHSLGADGRLEGDGKQSRYAQMIYLMLTLIDQARFIESEFHRHTFDFAQDYDERIANIRSLHKSIVRVRERIQHEQGNFNTYVANFRSSRQTDRAASDFLCSKGACPATREANEDFFRYEQQKRIVSRTIWTLRRVCEKLELMQKGTERLIRQADMRDEAIKARSENEARRKSGEMERLMQQADAQQGDAAETKTGPDAANHREAG